MNIINNSKGKIWYGLHFYPGVAEYQEPNKDPYRVFLNENTLRSMDSTFAGKPVFVEHVDEVEPNLDELRKEADGWVVESFYNAADGKHWVKLITVTDRAERAIKNGMKLSNAYIPVGNYGPAGLWNGVSYSKEILAAEYEHLAIVRNPRYEESVILTPEQFKQYNENHVVELKRIANSKQGEKKMASKFSLFTKTKVENAADVESMSVLLPSSGKEMSIKELVEGMDKIQNMHGYASTDHMVKVGENEMSVGDLVKAHMKSCNEVEEMKKKNAETEEEAGAKKEAKGIEEEEKQMNDGDEDMDPSMDNAEDEDEEKKKKEDEKKKNAKAKADAVRNAHLKLENELETVTISTMASQVALGKELYGAKR